MSYTRDPIPNLGGANLVEAITAVYHLRFRDKTATKGGCV